jgi:hypothetical protein
MGVTFKHGDREWDLISRREVMAAGLACSVPAWAQGTGNRVALVIGNAAYAAAPLPNAANDAKAMSAVLRSMGFEVIEVRDAGKQRMEEAIALSRAMLQGRKGVGLLYYAGHGLQVDWRNYMVPVDAAMETAADVPRQCVDIQGAIEAFRVAGNSFNIVVLDACRDNPFRAASTGKGLAPLEAPAGTYLAYATAPGNLAEDGTDGEGNGLFTRFLLKEIQRPAAGIEEIFKRVRLQVRQASQGRQVPWEMSSLEADFVFASGLRAESPARAEQDRLRLVQMEAWNQIRASTSPADFFAFLLQHPVGEASEWAAARLQLLQAPSAAPQPGRDGVRIAALRRYRHGERLSYQHYEMGWSRRATRRSLESVSAIDGHKVFLSNGDILDIVGGVLETARYRYDPGYLMTPADLAVGRRWQSRYLQTIKSSGELESEFSWSHVAQAIETIEVPAGRFTALRIAAQGDRRLWQEASNPVQRHQRTYWLDVQTLVVLREELIARGHQSTIVAQGSRELLSMENVQS